MGGEEESQSNTQGGATKRKESTPPDGYVCRLCSVPGHWIQVCPTKKTGDKKRKRTPSDHVPVPGKDPSPEDVAEAQKMQEILLRNVSVEKHLVSTSKKRDDETQCRFARPADLELNKMKARAGNKAAQKKAEQEESAQKRKETKQIKKAKVEQSEKKKQVEAAAEEDNDDSSSSSGSSSSSDEDSEGEAKKVDSDSSSSDDDEE
ncbi:hypothetical protein QTG54_004142 [Skeletonema marinoi]|uniref:Zinc knuckle CX2CX3GHX4C domain-containing protein n=1 Tax=Skeletonema marinoi TaxID=267567 RepID=A0AAD9DEN1_9STRA|nr:hypothetical protein QTG54_004142 [Skeletonema marinoi]